MSKIKQSSAVGVIKGRFQAPEPHKGHEYTIEEALKRHKEVLMIIGTTYETTAHDPMPFILRKMMLEGKYPGRLRVIEDPFNRSEYDKRSSELTELIEREYPGRDAVIYGARDSIVHTYSGRFSVVETKTVFSGSATELRETIEYEDDVKFRRGYIKAVMDRKPIHYPAVDVAVISANVGQVLLIGIKEEPGKFRFPGVFYTPGVDASYEAAAERCIGKEMPGITADFPQIVQSCIINDSRYKKTHDGVITLLMRSGYGKGTPRPGKGIRAVKWVDYWFNKVPNFIAKTHQPLAEIMQHRWHY